MSLCTTVEWACRFSSSEFFPGGNVLAEGYYGKQTRRCFDTK